MKICKSCHAIFESPSVKYPLSGSRHEEDCELVCPECGSTAWTDAEKCPRCGEWHDGKGSFCPDCMEYIADCMTDLFDGLDSSARQDMEYEVKQWIDQNW